MCKIIPSYLWLPEMCLHTILKLLSKLIPRLKFSFAPLKTPNPRTFYFRNPIPNSSQLKVLLQKQAHQGQKAHVKAKRLTSTRCFEIGAAVSQFQASVIAVAWLVAQVFYDGILMRLLNHTGAVAARATQIRVSAIIRATITCQAQCAGKTQPVSQHGGEKN